MSLFPLTVPLLHSPSLSFSLQHEPNSHFIVLRSLWIHMNIKQTSLKSAWLKPAQSSATVINIFLTFTQSQQHWQNDTLTTKSLIKSLCHDLFSFRYYFKVQARNVFGLGPVSDTLTYVTESGVYHVSACKDKLWDAPLIRVQTLIKLALDFLSLLYKNVCNVQALHKSVMVMFILLQYEIFKYKTILEVEAGYQMYTALWAFWVVHSHNQVNASDLSVCVPFLPCEMIAFFLSDDPLLIERPPGKSICWLHISTLKSPSHVLLKLHILSNNMPTC